MFKKIIQVSFLVLFITFGISAVAGADTLFTPPLEVDFADSPDASLVCNIANISHADQQIVVEVINIDGDSISSVMGMVAAGARLGAAQGSDNGNATPSHCKFTVVNGQASSVRASGCIFRTGTGCISAVSAY